jgi:methyl-accepting chemotaxis protein
MTNLSISTRLFLGFGFILFLIMLIAFIGDNRVGIIDANMKEVGQGASPKQRYAINFRGSVHDRAISIRDAVLVEDSANLKKHLDEIDTLKQFYAESANALDVLLKNTPPSPQEKTLLNAIINIEKQTLALTERVIRLRQAGQINEAKKLLLTETSPAYSAWLKSINDFIDFQEATIKEKVGEVESVANNFSFIILLITFIALVVGILVALWNVRSINRPIDALMKSMINVQKNGDFSQRAPVIGSDEIANMAQAFNSLLASTEQAVDEVNRVVGAMSKGQFDQRVNAHLQGDLNTLKQGVNGSVIAVSLTMHELGKVMDALYNGDFSVKMDERVEGDFRVKVENAMGLMETTVADIIRVMGKMQNGKFRHRVEAEAHGELDALKVSINKSMDLLEGAMNDITRIVVAQAKGDLSNKISADYHGELRLMKEAVNATADKLIQVVSKVTQVSTIVGQASQEVLEGAKDLNQRVQEQAAALEQTSATMDQMNAAVKNNTDNARQTAKVAQQVRNQATEGAAVMQKTIVAMNTIQASSHKIADIVSLIDGIAFQTNLLALNAAVEAARAGDHGRGFAVVAGEVRGLAQKSAEAAKDIKTLINESVAQINEGTQLAAQSGQVLQGINQAIDDVAVMIEHIAQASSEQTEGIKQVHNAIAQIDGVTQQNAALVEQTSAASESLSEQASILQEDMAFFQAQKTPQLDRMY